jgi:hypothetical protein
MAERVSPALATARHDPHVTIDSAVGLAVLGLAFGAAAIRSRDPFWALLSITFLGVVGYRVIGFGVDATQLVANTDQLLALIGLLLMAATVAVTMGLPKSLQDRLF